MKKLVMICISNSLNHLYERSDWYEHGNIFKNKRDGKRGKKKAPKMRKQMLNS